MKFAVDAPSGITTAVIVVVSAVSRNKPALELLDRLTVIAPIVVGWLDAFCRCTVIDPLVWPVTGVRGGVRKTSWLAPPITVTDALGPPGAAHEPWIAVTV